MVVDQHQFEHRQLGVYAVHQDGKVSSINCFPSYSQAEYLKDQADSDGFFFSRGLKVVIIDTPSRLHINAWKAHLDQDNEMLFTIANN